jgi:phenylpyruvate tautomerase PptA (4-oxalocrotonate tautomerase family)
MAGKARNLLLPGNGTAGRRRPDVDVHAVEGRTLGRKRALVRDITAAVVRNLNLSADGVMPQIIHSAKQNEAKAGVRFSER